MITETEARILLKLGELGDSRHGKLLLIETLVDAALTGRHDSTALIAVMDSYRNTVTMIEQLDGLIHFTGNNQLIACASDVMDTAEEGRGRSNAQRIAEVEGYRL